MRLGLGIVAIACFAGVPAQAQNDAPTSSQDREITPAMAKVFDFAKQYHCKVVLYSELDDRGSSGQPIIGMGIVLQPIGSTALYRYEGDKRSEFAQAVVAEAKAAGKEAWREILIIADDKTVSASREKSPGPIEGFNDRWIAQVHRLFPGSK